MPSDMIGKNFGSYKIVAQLGQGGMASVYRGYQEAIDRSVAIKIMPAELLHDPNFIKRFTMEARTLAKLSHPNILPLYDFGEANGVPYIIMPLMSGGTLVERIRRGPMPPAEIARILVPVADALNYAHDEGLLHRDIKPNNILFDARDTPVVADFGIAKYLESASSLTGTGIIGTPDYMSPEQARGEQLDRRADVYSLAVVAYQMLTGQSLFKATTPMGVIFKHVSEMPRPIRELRPDAPPAVEAVVMKSLAKSAAERHQTTVEFARAFSAAVEPATRRAPPSVAPTVRPAVPDAASSVTRIEPYSPVTQRQPQPQPLVQQKRGGAATWLIVVGVIVVVALCVTFGVVGVGGLGLLGLGSAAATAEAATATAQVATGTAAARQTSIAQEATATAQVVEATQAALAANISRWTSWPVLYSDDFTSDTRRWTTGPFDGERASGRQSIAGGVYLWDVNSKSGVHLRGDVEKTGPVGDFYISVEARLADGPSDADYGLVLRRVDSSFYYFSVAASGDYYSFSVLQNGTWTTLIEWTKTGALSTSEPNRLTVIGEGARFYFFINNELIAEYEDSRLPSGEIGLGIELNNRGDNGVFEFDNFVLRSP